MQQIKNPPCVMSVAGSDSGAGAGVQADLKTITALGGYAVTAISAVTAQNTRGVGAVHVLPADIVAQQVKMLLDDFAVGAIKLGMLGDGRVVCAVADVLRGCVDVPMVIDPVLVSTSGQVLLDEEGVEVMKQQLLPVAALVTPNVPEMAFLLGKSEGWVGAHVELAFELFVDDLGVKAVLLKGGHRDSERCEDVLFVDGVVHRFDAPRLVVRNSHGTGCTLSAAIATGLAKGCSLVDAVGQAKRYLNSALGHADALRLGSGRGGLNHFVGHFGF